MFGLQLQFRSTIVLPKLSSVFFGPCPNFCVDFTVSFCQYMSVFALFLLLQGSAR
jgi:hypothetical protein